MNNYFKVLRPGINSTFQDLGRFGLQHLGIVASGCMDQLSFCISNKLVGNKVSEGALEFAYQGPLLELVGESALVAISGKVNFIESGEARIIFNDNGRLKTISKVSFGEVIGAISLIRNKSCENVRASKELIAISLSDREFQNLYKNDQKFRSFFEEKNYY